MTECFQLGKFLGVLFLFAGFLVSIEVFREFRVPFTSIALGRTRHEPAGGGSAGGRGRGRDEQPATEASRRLTPASGRRPAGAARPPYHGPMSPPPAAATAAPRQPHRPRRSPRPSGLRDRHRGRGAVRDARAAVALRLRRRDGAARVRRLARRDRPGRRPRCSSPGGSAAATDARPRLGDLDRGARVSLCRRRADGVHPQPRRCSSRSTSSRSRWRCSASTRIPDGRGGQCRARARALDRPRVVALALAVAGMVAVVASQLDPAAGIRFDAHRRSGWRSARRSARRSSWSSAGPATGRSRPSQAMAVVLAATVVVQHRARAADRAGGRARRTRCAIPSILPLLAVHRPLRGSHPVDPVPDRHPARSAGRGPGS